MSQLLAVSILAVMSLATYGMPFQADKSTKDVEAKKDIEVQYDKFKDRTTVSTTITLSEVQDHLVGFSATAVREGQATASSSRFHLSIYTSDIIDSDDAKLILLVDGVRSTLTSPFSNPHGAVFPITIEQLTKIGAAKSVEGQMGSIEFALTPAQRAQLKRFVEYFQDKVTASLLDQTLNHRMARCMLHPSLTLRQAY
jgi:hypothetical protein